MAAALAEDAALVRDGKVPVRLRGLTDLASYPRQRLKKLRENGKALTVVPLNDFLQNIRPGIGAVSKNVELHAMETATEHSYRKTEAIVEKKLGRETIRRSALKTGEKAKAMPALRTEERVIPEQKLKDAGDSVQTYKQSQGSSIRQRIGKLLNLQRLFLLVDGVQVFLQEKGDGREGGRECKVGAILRQNNEKISEMATWCTWGRIRAFRALTAAAWLAIAVITRAQAVIVSDGAPWIRQTRKWIPGLANAVWILDWFHLKDHLLKCLSLFGFDEASEIVQKLSSLLWRGQADAVARLIKGLLRALDVNERSEAEAAVKNFLAYLNNQREGIVNYEAYRQQGCIVGSGFVEKLNDTLIKNRMVRGKRMRWSLSGGEAMMALLSAKRNGRLAEMFA